MNESQRQSLEAVIAYNWVDELDDYRDCVPGESDTENSRIGHVFEHLICLDNFLRGTNFTPGSYL